MTRCRFRASIMFARSRPYENRLITKVGLFLGVVALATPGVAATATDDFQIWNVVNFTGQISEAVPIALELSGRLVDDSGRLGVLIVRPTIGYRISDALTVSVGYMHQKTINDGLPDIAENRIHQQVNWHVAKIGVATLTARTRLEQRWIEGRRGTGWRLRERLQLQVPLERKGANFIIANETMFALNKTEWGAQAGVDQVRTFVGVNVPLNKTVTLETGYQNRYQRRMGFADRIDHIIPITVSIKL